MDGDRRKSVLKSWMEKGNPTKESVTVSFCCVINHSKTQWLKTITISIRAYTSVHHLSLG